MFHFLLFKRGWNAVCFRAHNDCWTTRFIQFIPNGRRPSKNPKWPPCVVVTKTMFSFSSNLEYGKAAMGKPIDTELQIKKSFKTHIIKVYKVL